MIQAQGDQGMDACGQCFPPSFFLVLPRLPFLDAGFLDSGLRCSFVLISFGYPRVTSWAEPSPSMIGGGRAEILEDTRSGQCEPFSAPLFARCVVRFFARPPARPPARLSRINTGKRPPEKNA